MSVGQVVSITAVPPRGDAAQGRLHVEGDYADDPDYLSNATTTDMFVSVMASDGRCVSRHAVRRDGTADTLVVSAGAAVVHAPGAAAAAPPDGQHWSLEIPCEWFDDPELQFGLPVTRCRVRALGVTMRDDGSFDVYDWERWVRVIASPPT